MTTPDSAAASDQEDGMSAVEALLVLLELARARTRDAADVHEAIRWRTVRALAQIAYDELPEGVKPNG